MELTDNLPKQHIGKNIERIRTYFGIKQSALASDIGLTQHDISNIEHQEEIDKDLLLKISNALGVTPEIIKSFDAEKVIYQINHVADHAFEKGSTAIFQQLNPVEKIVELYERLLKSEREKIDILRGIKN